VDDALKTRGNIYLNVETSLLFAPLIKISGYVPGNTALTLGWRLVHVIVHSRPPREITCFVISLVP